MNHPRTPTVIGIPAPLRLPSCTPVPVPYPAMRPAEDRDTEHLLDVAAAAAKGAYALCGSVDYVEAICKLACDQDAMLNLLRDQLAEAQRELHGAQLALDEERNEHQVTVLAREAAEVALLSEQQECLRLQVLHAKLSARMAAEERARISDAAERLGGHRDADTIVVDVPVRGAGR